MGTIWQDLGYGARLLLKKPRFTIAALAMLTLGVGASTTILCVIDAVLLAPLPFPEPDRLLKLEERHPGVSSYNFTYANYFDLARTTRTLHDVAAYRPWQFNLSEGREPETVDCYLVTSNFFAAVGITPPLGRTITALDDRPGSDHVVILSYLEGVRREIWSVDPEWPLARIRTMKQVLASSVAQRRFSMVLAGVFASISLALAAIGIAGVMAFATEQRTQEIGIRRALGAHTVDIVQMVLSLGFRLIFLGIAIGLAAALVSSRFLTHLLFGLSASDPFTYFAAATVVVLAAAIACYLPARSATRVDPMVVLRYE